MSFLHLNSEVLFTLIKVCIIAVNQHAHIERRFSKLCMTGFGLGLVLVSMLKYS